MPNLGQTSNADAAVARVLRQYWGFDSLRPLQAEAIQAGLAGRDSVVVLPTGGGKSLCYQIPPLIAERTDVVVSPLISLMKDQVDGLLACGYPAVALNTGMTAQEIRAAESDICERRARLVFAAPERVLNGRFLNLMRQADVRSVAIDEAHCISHWGHDFRPEYRRLAELRDIMPQASMHAFTATATQRVRGDIAQQLRLRAPATLVGSFDRPNLVYRVMPRVDTHEQTLEIIRRHERQAVIVYCISRRDTESLASHLRASGVRAEHYHAGMAAGERRGTQDRFSQERIDVVVATVAFGMGIDRSDVRCVIHAATPKSIEHYQQETGRAGRDGLEAECVLLYSHADVAKWESLIVQSAAGAEDPEPVIQSAMARLGEMRAFAVAPRCRHRALVEYFGQAYEKPDCGACDVCLGEGGETIDGTVAARKILSCVARVKERFGAGHVVAVLRGAQTERIAQCGHEQLSTYGLMRDTDEKTLKNMVYQLLDQSLLERSTDGLPTLRLNAASWHVMRGERTVRFIPPQTRVRKARVDRESWEDVDLRLFEALRGLRREIADERRVPPFVIFSDATLRDLARQRPTEDETLRAVHGVGPRKAADFGERFCGLIAAHCAERGLSVNAVAPRAVAAAQRGDLPASGVRDTTAYSASRASASRASASGASAPGATGAKLEAWQMFAAGASVEEVMAATSRARSTTSGYLAEFIEQERPESIAPWVDDATYARVAGAITELDATTRMKPVFEHLGGEVPYDLIRLVFAHAGVGIAAPGT